MADLGSLDTSGSWNMLRFVAYWVFILFLLQYGYQPFKNFQWYFNVDEMLQGRSPL